MKKQLQTQLTVTKQQHILKAAAQVFAQKGFHASTIKDVAATAGVAHGSVYTYFESKEALLLGLFNLMTAQAQTVTRPSPAPQQSPHAFLSAALRQPLAAFTHGNAELFRIILSEALVNRTFAERFQAAILEPMFDSIKGFLSQIVFSEWRSQTELELQVRAMSSLIFGVIVQRALQDDLLESHWEDVPDLLAGLLLDGLNGVKV
ncbi:TetR/AcrR family transcriptional regulator [Deinococcus humi]|uniref:AcrR family transcriptional regulator n=1 Tax=Deinococcus humi TaxID=662880 RepID=A0A7W8JT91_9DEIO|nr:TetR/AcrR family transcriptional regulator [Deinococcus humi]MBB5362781.1 AcrR family transcriptional regulator [Deinococcus humi]GGO26269.1 TetR family transcriptional regulator [Deinococcus humi]